MGVKPNFSHYSADEIELIQKAEKIYYPTTFYADLLDTAGKKTFPSYHTYKCVQDKIKQTALYSLLRIPHPRTIVFYGKKQQQTITSNFMFPFIGKIPRGSSMGRGVFLITNSMELDAYLHQTRVAYIQEYLPVDRDIRVVVIGTRAVHSYWRMSPSYDFRCNTSIGAQINLAPVPQEAIELALHTAAKCRWDDVGLDIINYQGHYIVIEANMKYGTLGFKKAGIDLNTLMESMLANKEI